MSMGKQIMLGLMSNQAKALSTFLLPKSAKESISSYKIIFFIGFTETF